MVAAMVHRRGQITLFIILGILLLGGILAFFLINNLEFGSENVGQELRESVPTELEPLRQFVEQCLYDISVEGLQRSGLQGGYIDANSFGIVENRADATEARGLTMSSRSPITVPYYYYLESNNECVSDCLFYSQQPPLQGTNPRSVSSQLGRYIENEMLTCLNGFEAMYALGMNVNVEGAMDTTITFSEEDVLVTLDYPVQIVQADEVLTLDKYQARIFVPYKRMYEYATTIAASSERFHFLENHLLEMIAVHSDLSRDKLPPFSATTFEFASTLFWIRTQVEQSVTDLLFAYTPGLQVANSKNYQVRTFPGKNKDVMERLLANMVLPLEEQGFNDFEVGFEYLGWPYYFNMNNNDEVIRPDSQSIDFFPFFGTQVFNNLYDVSYPVRVAIESDDALNGEGFVFSFALEANIRNNEPMTLDFDQRLAEPNVVFLEPPFCEPQHRNSGNVTYRIVDGITGEPVEEVGTAFSCGELSCSIEQNDGVTNLPVCSGGVFSALKQGYANVYVPVFTSFGENTDIGELVLEPYRTRKIEIKKIPLVKSFGRWTIQTEQVRDIGPFERAILVMEQVDPNFGELDNGHTVAAEITGEFGDVVIDVVPGYYKVNVVVMDEKGMTIYPDYRETGGLFSESYAIPDKPLTLDQFIAGGVEMDEETGFLYVDKGQLDSTDTLELYVLGLDFTSADPLIIEDLEIMSSIRQYSASHHDWFGFKYRTTNWEERR